MGKKYLPPVKLSEADKLRIASRGYSVEEPLASGGFGVVYRASCHNEPRAAKVIEILKISKSHLSEDLANELAILKSINHTYVVEVFDYFLISNDRMIIFMELAEGGDMYDLVRSKVTLTEKVTGRYYGQIVQALVFMHSKGLAHRDLKPPNILLDKSQQECKLTDFGLGRLAYDLSTGQKVMSDSRCGTRSNMAPEVLMIGFDENDTSGYCPLKADVWSSGTVLFFMLHGRYPFRYTKNGQDQSKQQLEAILKFNITFNKISSEAKDCILRHLNIKPELRPSMKDIATDPWFAFAEKLPEGPEKKSVWHDLCTVS